MSTLITGWWPARQDPDAALELAPLDANDRGEWAWTQPHRFAARWHLNCGGRTIATLAGRGILGTRVHARFARESWELHTEFGHSVTVTRVGETAPFARFRPSWWSGGRLELASGTTLLWRRESFWGRRWAFLTSELLPLVRFVARPRFLRLESVVEIEDAARRMPELPALVALGWLLVAQSHRGHASRH